MTRTLRFPLIALTCTLLAASAAAGEPETADDVVARYVEAIGGKEKLAAVKSMKQTGKIIFGGGMEAPMTMEEKRPDKLRMEFSFQGMTATQAYDGTTGWFIMPFMGKTEPEKMSQDQLDAFRDQADIDGPLVGYREKGHKLELVGKDSVEGTDVYKLKLTKKSGNVEYHYLDAEYFIPVKVEGEREFQGTQVEYTVVLGDYKEVDGLLMPHSIQQQSSGPGGGSVAIESIELNVPIADERFAMPKTTEKAEQDESAPAANEKKDQNDGSGS